MALTQSKDQILSTAERFNAASVMTDLRRRVGDREFGYRAQALFAHVLLRIGGQVEEIRHQGHPDIIGRLVDKRVLIEVEVASATSRVHILKAEDVTAVASTDGHSMGLLAVLDCAVPIRWIVIGWDVLKLRPIGTISLTTLQAIADQGLSARCTLEFVRLVESNKMNLQNLTFHLLRLRALRGDVV
jgi:hypothetical protein